MEVEKAVEPNSMAIATVSDNGFPSLRYVLLKDLHENKFYFYTNYGSRKASELAKNNKIAATFYWPTLNRSIRVEGEAEKGPEEMSDEYFNSRPLKSRISSSLSK